MKNKIILAILLTSICTLIVVYKFNIFKNLNIEKIKDNNTEEIIVEKKLPNENLEPFKFQNYPVEVNFKNIKPIQFTGEYKLEEAPGGYWSDWKNIFADYSSSSTKNNLAGNYKLFELPNGNFVNFAIVDVSTGKIYSNKFNYFLGGVKYLFKPDSKLIKVVVPNSHNFYIDKETYKDKFLNISEETQIYFYFVLERGEVKLLGTYVFYEGKFVEIKNLP